MVDRLTGALIERGSRWSGWTSREWTWEDWRRLLVDAATVVAATPTVMTHPHPLMVSALYLANALKPKVRFLSAMVTYGWATNAMEHIGDSDGRPEGRAHRAGDGQGPARPTRTC